MNYAISSPPHIRGGSSTVIDYNPTLMPESEDREQSVLVLRLKQQDPEALRELYDLYSRPVFSFLLRYLPDRATAEDVQQQVFMEAWMKADNFDAERGSLLTWLMLIARSRAIDSSRRRVPEPRDPQGAARDVEALQPERDEIDEAVDTWHFRQLLGRLPQEEADLLKYRFQGELSQSEIADTTGIPLGTVKSRMVSGLRKLRTMMEAEA
ncbi:MAG: sigma-70 family RNA polymerase sigma factor [Solirubrobacterales bacterium]